MKNLIIYILLILIISAISVQARKWFDNNYYSKAEVEHYMQEEGYKVQGETLMALDDEIKYQKTQSYNSGYRMGRAEAVTELVECEKVNDPAALSMYLQANETLNELGETRATVFSCQE